MDKAIRVALQGWNGKKNIGDDAMTSVILHKLGDIGKPITVTLIADKSSLPHFGLTSSQLTLECIHRSPSLTQFKLMRKLTRIQQTYRLTHQRDLYMLGGGSIYQHAAVIQQTLSNIQKARRSNPNIKVVTLGVSLGPFNKQADERAAQALLKEFDFIGLRDLRSAELLKQLKPDAAYIVAPDIALLLPFICPMGQIERTDDIGISLRANHTDDHIINLCAQLAEAHISKRPTTRIRYFQFCALPKDDDLSLLGKLKDALPRHLHDRLDVVPYSHEPLNVYNQIATCAHMICVRLHAAVISYAVKTPFTVLPYHAKCVDFAHTVHAPQTVYSHMRTASENLEQAQNPVIFEKHHLICRAAERHFDWIKKMDFV